MTKFDEAPSAADGWRWLRPIGRQPAVFIAAIVAIGAVVGVAAAFLFAAQAARIQVARLIGETQFAVVLGPQVTRVEAEAMRGSLEALPLVGSAELQTREQALTRLAGSTSVAGGSRPNPLPDLWVLTARRPGTDAAMRTFADDRARLEQTLAGVPGVASVRVDQAWVAFVDRWVAMALRLLPSVQGATLAVLAALVFCIAFIAGRADAADGDARGSAGSGLVIGAMVGVLGLGVATGLGAAAGNIVGSTALEWAGSQAVRADAESPLVWLVATVLVASMLGTVVGRIDSPRPWNDRIRTD